MESCPSVGSNVVRAFSRMADRRGGARRSVLGGGAVADTGRAWHVEGRASGAEWCWAGRMHGGARVGVGRWAMRKRHGCGGVRSAASSTNGSVPGSVVAARWIVGWS